MNQLISLSQAYSKYFRIGAAVSGRSAVSRHDLLMRHFSSLTAENEMKYSLTEPEEGRFTFEHADSILSLAREMGIQIRGHAPVWHNQTPRWIFEDQGGDASPEKIFERIDAHSKAICRHFGKDVYAWDVVNEAVRDDPPGAGESPVYRNSPYFRICGERFIEAAFRSMDRYAKDAQLFYNDYGECIPEKRDRIVRLIRDMRDRGCRIDGMGMQQHYFSVPDLDELRRSLDIYAGLGLRIHITELDVSLMAAVNPGEERVKPDDPRYGAFIRHISEHMEEITERINDIYVQLFEVYRSYSDVIDCVTTWGVSDDMTWLDYFGVKENTPRVKQHPLLFDENGEPKPCVHQLIRDAQGA